ncbi:acyl-CoA dehydrogenase family protein [Oceanospirillum beijerinckii]|uniref:acyl-CoA dehydrogenase family protein n=1 Tax=Oceanospirillum beijerinckii TaxID=64976 RepID=UPI0003F740FF|nr:acyl-CoA dehydrogenase family protein [Oceanospirillum beijerinckii]
MEFVFTPEQQMIQDTARQFLDACSNSGHVRDAMTKTTGYDAELWQKICHEMYWQAIHIPEQYGGLGLGCVEMAILFEQMGRRLLCSPYFSTVALATNALLVAGTEAQKQHYLPRIADGSLTATLAYIGHASHGDNNSKDRYHNGWHTDSVTVTALPQFNQHTVITGYTLSGTLHYVPHGHTADLLVIAARLPDSSGEEGVSLFLLPSHLQGVEVQWTPSMDQTRPLAQITLNNVIIPADNVMLQSEYAWPLLEKTLQLACVALAAEQMGGAQQALDLTLEYTKERKQFGRAIASFQAIKHRMADMMLQVESARSAVYYAACIADEALQHHNPAAATDNVSQNDPLSPGNACHSSLDHSLADELPLASSLAKAYCSDAYFHCAAESIQLHGGVGFTWEYDPHLYFKRAKSSETLLGNASFHREKIAQIIL